MKSRDGRVIAALALCCMSALACGQVAGASSSQSNGNAGGTTGAPADTNSNAASGANDGASGGDGGAAPSNARLSDLVEGYDQLQLRFLDPRNGACSDDVSGDSYRVIREPPSIAFSSCDSSADPREPLSGTRLLGAASIDAITRALAKVSPTEAACARDYPMLTLDVTHGSDVALYVEGSCQTERSGGRRSVTGLLELHEVISALSK